MATIKFKDKVATQPDNTPIKKSCKDLGILFGCENGICRTCEIKIKKGQENLNSPTSEEKAHLLPDGHRLACQCTLKKGDLEITPANE